MTRSFFELAQSGWWLLLIVAVSLALSYFLYQKKNVPWSSLQNWILFALRSLAIFLVLFLLLEPSIKRIINTLEKPLIALTIDNSLSVVSRDLDSTLLKEQIVALEEALSDQGFETRKIAFSDENSLRFNAKTTRLSSLISKVDKIPNEENLVGTVLVTDGIFNRGSSPLYKSYLHPIFTVGLGDTIPPKDISISRVLYNKVTFKGNETPIRLEVSQQGFTGSNTSIRLSEGGKLLAEKKLELNTSIKEVEFLVSSEEEGLRHLTATIPFESEESTIENNKVDIFLEVIDGRQKILIVANTPHPDIKAIRRSLESTDSYATELYIPSIHEKEPSEIYDVVIYHGTINTRIYQPKERPGLWYILRGESPVNLVNTTIPYLNIEKRSSQLDHVSGSFNPAFSKYKIEDTEAFEELPPIEVPFGDYSVSGTSEVLMYQKLGSVVTDKPLMVVNDDGGAKSAVLVGQNIWKWKLQEAALNDNSQQFDNFITKTIQFLSVKNDKKQFRITPRSSTFGDSQPVLFDTEVYNDIYERVYGNEMQIVLIDENENETTYTFTDSQLNATFRAPGLAAGVFRFRATTTIGDKNFREQGEFLVENTNPEYLSLTANHRLLRNLSSKTNGQFVHYSDITNLPNIIEGRDFKPIMKSEEGFTELVKSWWYFLLIFLLFSTEWMLRRYWGGY